MIRRRRRKSLPTWGIPALYAAVALAAGLVLPRLEAILLPGSKSGLSASATLAIFSSIGSGMIALTGIVFSLAFVMVQFSSTAYSPRLVLWIARDATLWHAMGVFSATFLYAIAAMAWVERGGTQGTPFVSGWLVIGLLFASVAMLLGHEGCGAIAAALATKHEGGQVRSRVQLLLASIIPGLPELDPTLSPEEQASRAVESNVRWTVRQIVETPEVQARMAGGRTRIVGAVYEIETGRVRLLPDETQG